MLGAGGGVVGEGLLDGSLRTPPTGSGVVEPEALDRLTGLPGAVVPGGRDVDPEGGGGGREDPEGELAGGELADTEPEGRDDVDPDGVLTTRTAGIEDEELVDAETGIEIGPVGNEELPDDITVGIEADGELVVELELSEAGPMTVAGLLEEEVGREDDGPVGGELKDVEADEEDELLVVMLMGPTATEPELEVLPDEEDELGLDVGGAVDETEELELLGLDVGGGAVDETEELELLGLELDELVGTVLEEFEVVVDPQPEIVENTVAQKISLSRSVQESDVATQELLLTEVGGGVVVAPQPGIEVDEVEQEVVNPSSTLPRVVHDEAVAIHELLLTEVGGEVVAPHPDIEEYESSHDTVYPRSTFPRVVQDMEVARHELLLTEFVGGIVVI